MSAVLSVALISIGALVMIVGGVMFLIAAFHEGFLWALG